MGEYLYCILKEYILLIGCACCAFLLCNAALLSAAEIVVVKSSGIKPYNDALEGFKRTCMCTVTELNLPETGQNNIQKKIIRNQA